MFYYMHNNTNYQCKICWNKALTFGVGSIQLSFRIYHCVHPIHANMFSIQMLLHFSQIVPRVCTFLLFFLFLFQYFFVIKLCINFLAQYKHTYRQLQASHGSHMKAAHNVLYMKKHTKGTLHILRWTSAV